MADQPAVATGEASGGRVANGVAREALLAEMPFRDDVSPAAAEPAKVVKAEPVEPTAEVDDVEVAADPAEPTAADIEADATESQDEAVDPDTQKRLGLVERAEKRARQQLAAQRAEMEEERRAFIAEKKAITAERERFEAAKAKAKYDPVAVMRELGLSEDDFEHAAQQLYANSKAAASDPKRRAAADAAVRAREARTEVEQLKNEVAEMRAEKQRAAAQAEQAASVEQYVGSVAKEIDATKSPLAARHLAKSPAKAKAMIAAIASELLAETDEIPTAAEVVTAYEKRRRAQLEDEGIDVDALITKPAPTAQAKPTKTIGAKLGTQTPPAKPAAARTRADVLQEAIRELETGTADLD